MTLLPGTRLQSLDFALDAQGALYEQLARALKRAILDGHFVAAGRLPATRTLARTLGLSRNTVLGAYEILCAEGLAVARERSNTRVGDAARPLPTFRSAQGSAAQSRYAARSRRLPQVTLGALRPTPRFDLHYGEPSVDARLFHSWRRKVAAAALQAGPRYPDPGGFLPLRRAICDYLARHRGIVCAANEVLIVGGTQQAVTLIARVLLDEGDVAVIEEPHYPYLLQVLMAHGARVVSVRTDESGLQTAGLARHRARLVCVTPSHQFPSGSVMTLERRIELLRIVSKLGGFVLEDDYDSEFRYEGRPLAALRSLDLSGRVIYVGTFSKTLFPSLRLGYIVCPAALRDDLFSAKRLDDLGSPVIEQAALAAFIHSRQFEKHVRRCVAQLRQSRDALLKGLERHAGNRIEVHGSQSGVHVVVWFRRLSYLQLERFLGLAAERGLGLYPIHPCYRGRPARPGLLLGYAGLSAPSLEAATLLFGQCLDDVDGNALQAGTRKQRHAGT